MRVVAIMYFILFHYVYIMRTVTYESLVYINREKYVDISPIDRICSCKNKHDSITQMYTELEFLSVYYLHLHCHIIFAYKFCQKPYKRPSITKILLFGTNDELPKKTASIFLTRTIHKSKHT